jgi:hypothetical protein
MKDNFPLEKQSGIRKQSFAPWLLGGKFFRLSFTQDSL